MSKFTIKLTSEEWFKKIRPKLIEEFGVSICASYVQKRKLGFTARKAHGYKENYEEVYYIDFSKEEDRLYFMLRWI